MRRADFRFDLPESLIAQRPLDERGASRLLVLAGESIRHGRFDDLLDLISPDDLLVVNDSRVIKARLIARKDSGGRAEVLVERIADTNRALCQVRVSKPLKPDRALYQNGHRIDVVARDGEFYLLDFNTPVAEYLDAHGHVPLPPYIERPPDAADEDRYQTVYAAVPGAVAAPTAGLHFDDDLLQRLQANGVGVVSVTLHVGAGTFQPVREDDLSRHRMHAERYAIPRATRRAIDACNGRVIAVGTTVVRTLESAAATGQDCGETRLFITPGYRFRAVDALVTNFHLPESTLLMLVSAFAGVEPVRRAYAEAVKLRYRFFSYGDAMFCVRNEDGDV
ncbi:MAG: tRNA preQ1(34) S-adenosylmethionine ribosyltransferase-isomerase QueA [Gammaproteobacteria bacterium]|nr:tRNA preQ1(34) S-adenosylmethionine ribosyltransferase-isomerase QueA [Gammaproteobacteria bacterium]